MHTCPRHAEAQRRARPLARCSGSRPSARACAQREVLRSMAAMTGSASGGSSAQPVQRTLRRSGSRSRITSPCVSWLGMRWREGRSGRKNAGAGCRGVGQGRRRTLATCRGSSRAGKGSGSRLLPGSPHPSWRSTNQNAAPAPQFPFTDLPRRAAGRTLNAATRRAILVKAVTVPRRDCCAPGPVGPAASCGCSSMVEQELPKLTTGVRFPSPAPVLPS
jgi:hypothetical protein